MNINKIKFSYYSTLTIYIVFCIILITLIRKRIHRPFLHNKGKMSEMKYILLWTEQKNIPFINMGEGRSGFIDRKCPYTNCIVTGNKSLLGSYTAFDAIVFAGPDLVRVTQDKLPIRRLSYQKYVFASIESPANYPLCYYDFDGYYNWTWTYKLDSEVQWGYITIKDSDNKIIGPRKDMHWIKPHDMKPVSEEFKQQLKSKRIAAAWFVSNCRSKSRREGFVLNLQNVLHKYDLVIDVYGQCGSQICPPYEQDKCNKLVSRDYYFYLSFENAFSEDYVTEKLLIPLQNNAVPIVYGGANYTRFLPDGSYLNARELGIYMLAKMMDQLIKDPERYANMFRWKIHYSYHKTTDSVETNEYCKMCAALNDEEAIKRPTVYEDFRSWWEPFADC